MSGHKAMQCCQVCWSVENEKTLKQEVKGLAEALSFHKLDTVIGNNSSNDESGDIGHDGKNIRILPFWHYALSP